MRKLVSAVLLALLAFSQAVAQPKMVVYYPDWAKRPVSYTHDVWPYIEGMPPSQVDWTGVTHVVNFHGNDNVFATEPFFRVDTIATEYGGNLYGGRYVHYLDSLFIASGFNAKFKVLETVQAVSGATMSALLQNDATSRQLAHEIAVYVKARGFGGVDIDLESKSSSLTTAQMVAFLGYLRAELPAPYVIGVAASPFEQGFYAAASVDPLVDYYDIQAYGGSTWDGQISHNAVWELSPLYRGPNPDPGNFVSLNDSRSDGNGSIMSWVAAGHAKSKIVAGISTNGEVVNGVDTIFASDAGKVFFYQSYWSSLTLQNYGGTLVWDGVRKASYVKGTATASLPWPLSTTTGTKFICIIKSPDAMAADAQWVLAQGLGGIMVYEITYDANNKLPFGQRNPVLSAATSVFAGVLPAPTGTISVSPASLPYGGGQVAVSWTSVNATSVSVAPGIGTVAANGATNVTVSATTTFTLTVTGTGGTATYPVTVSVASAPPPVVSTYDTVTVLNQAFYIRKMCTDTTIQVPVRIQKAGTVSTVVTAVPVKASFPTAARATSSAVPATRSKPVKAPRPVTR